MVDLKSRRLELGLTLEEVGELIGVGKSTVRKWETGDIDNMRRDKIALLAKALKISPLQLIYQDRYPSEVQMDISVIYDKLEPYRKEKVYNFTKNELEDQNKKKTVMTYGQTAAGQPITYGDELVEEKEVSFIPKDADCALVIKGDSMTPEFHDGSVVFYKLQPTLENGELGIFEIDGEGVTLKKIKYDYENKKIILQSLNDKYEDMVFDSDQIRILGKAIKFNPEL